MGKWTAEYHDHVLGAKMKSLVSGAIKRARLEKVGEHTITYEAFVEDLDRGDSFTTSLIEVLVKEVAERRHRRHASDRGLIGDSTARSLRKLCSPASIYRERGTARVLPRPTEYLSQLEPLDMDEEEDELGPYSMYTPVAEGTRLNSDLFDAYRNSHGWPSSANPYYMNPPHTSQPPSSAPLPDTISDRVLPPLVDGSPPPRQSVWPVSSSGGSLHSTLSRQPSIRRPGRNRMADFSEWTTVRRNSTRPLVQDDDHADRESPAEPSSAMLGSRAPVAQAQARRFFPFGGRARRFEIIPTPRPVTSTVDDWYFPPHAGWQTTSPGPEREGERASEESGEERLQPRLRRGGLRAPEALLSRHGSPALPPTGVPRIVFPSSEELQRVNVTAPAFTTDRSDEEHAG